MITCIIWPRVHGNLDGSPWWHIKDNNLYVIFLAQMKVKLTFLLFQANSVPNKLPKQILKGRYHLNRDGIKGNRMLTAFYGKCRVLTRVVDYWNFTLYPWIYILHARPIQYTSQYTRPCFPNPTNFPLTFSEDILSWKGVSKSSLFWYASQNYNFS